MSLSAIERAFLEKLAGMKQGRLGLTHEGHDRARAEFADLIDAGLVIERQIGFHPGFQITSAGRERIGGSHD